MLEISDILHWVENTEKHVNGPWTGLGFQNLAKTHLVQKTEHFSLEHQQSAQGGRPRGAPQMMSQLSGNTGDCGQASCLKTMLSPPIDLLGFSNSTCLGAIGNLRGFLMMVFIVTVV